MLLSGAKSLSMASLSIYIGSENDPLPYMEDEVEELLSNHDIPKCKGMPRHLWMTKCVSLYNNNRIVVGE